MPSGVSSGALIVDTGLNNSKFMRGAQQFKNALNSLKNTVNRVGQDMSRNGDTYTRTIGEQTKATRALNREIAQTNKQYMDVVREMNQIQKTGGDSKRYAQLSAEAQKLSSQLVAMRSAKNELGGVEAGFDHVAAGATRARQSIISMIAGGAWSYLKKLAVHAGNAAVQLARLAGRAIVSGIRKIGSAAGTAAKSLFGLNRNAKKSNMTLKRGLWNLIKYGLGIRSLYVLFNRLRTAIKDGFSELAKQDVRVKESLTTLKTALGGLKGSLAAAFAPILTAITPALETLINMLTRAITTIGMFFAALTGQSYTYVSKGVASVGDSAKSSSKKVQELKRQLAGFDELNILSANNGSSGGGGSSGDSAGFTYEKQPISSAIKNFVDEMKRMFADGEYEQIGAVLANGINKAIAKVQNLVKWENIKSAVTRVIDTAAGIFNGFVKRIKWKKLGESMAEAANSLIKTAEYALLKFDFVGVAKGITESINRFISRVEWEKLGKTIATFAGKIIMALKTALTEFKWGDTGTKLAAAINGFFRQQWIWTAAGDTINKAIRGLLDFTKNFVVTFDAVQAAKDIKAALSRIDWEGIARDVWDLAKIAFGKAGDFIKVLLGGDIYDTSKNAVDQLWARGSGETSSAKYAKSTSKLFSELATTILSAIKKAFDSIPWSEWGDKLRDFLINIEWDKVWDAAYQALVSFLQGLGDFFGSLLFGKDRWDQFNAALNKNIGGGTGKTFGEILGDALIGKPQIELLKKVQEYGQSKGFNILGAVGGSMIGKPIAETIGKGISSGVDFFKKTTKKIADTFNPIVDKAALVLKSRVDEVNKNFEQNKTYDTPNWLPALIFGGNSLLDKAEDVYDSADDMVTGLTAAAKQIGENAKNGNINEPDVLDKVVNTAVKSAVFGPLNFLLPTEGKKTAKTPEEMRTQFGLNGGDLAGWDNLFSDNTSALEQNTKATVAQVKGIKKIDSNTTRTLFSSKHAQLAYETGASSAGTTISKMQDQTVNVPINFLPAGLSSYLNKPLEYLKNVFAPGTDAQTRVSLIKQGWTTIAAFVGNAVSVVTTLLKGNWSSIGGFVGNLVNVATNLYKGNYRTISDFVGDWIDVQTFLTNRGTNWQNGLVQWITGNRYGEITVGLNVGLTKLGAQVLANIRGRALGGWYSAGGIGHNFASGGIIRNGISSAWSKLPRYANGTARAHGTMFIAGEAGPEIVGHINGRTEILNKSQLAQTMQSAVSSGMVNALRGITFKMPAMATGGIMPYEVSAQIAKSAADIQGTLDANNEDLIQTIISVIGAQTTALVTALTNNRQTVGGQSAQQIINEINRRTQMFSASPLAGV